MKVQFQERNPSPEEVDRPMLGKAVISPETPEEEKIIRAFKRHCGLNDNIPRLSVAFWRKPPKEASP